MILVRLTIMSETQVILGIMKSHIDLDASESFPVLRTLLVFRFYGNIQTSHQSRLSYSYVLLRT